MAIFNTIVQGSGGGSDPYPLLSRVTDDNNNEIGTVAGYFVDGNNQKYAVVCLDAQYRPSTTLVMASPIQYTDLPLATGALGYGDTNTATYNCSKMAAQTPGYTAGIDVVNAISFTIDGETYRGQVPNFPELLMIIGKGVALNSADTSLSQYSSLALPEDSIYRAYQSSTQRSTVGSWIMNSDSFTGSGNRSNDYWHLPILEIPIN